MPAVTSGSDADAGAAGPGGSALAMAGNRRGTPSSPTPPGAAGRSRISSTADLGRVGQARQAERAERRARRQPAVILVARAQRRGQPEDQPALDLLAHDRDAGDRPQSTAATMPATGPLGRRRYAPRQAPRYGCRRTSWQARPCPLPHAAVPTAERARSSGSAWASRGLPDQNGRCGRPAARIARPAPAHR